ncbi:archease [Chloroflexota bacterium]
MVSKKNGFEIIDHTADIGIVAYGEDMEGAFTNAGKALFSIITELDDIKEQLHRDIELSAPDQESLLVEWLNELIYLFDTENLIFKRFDITQFNQTHLTARNYGQRVTPEHKIKTGVKAATYHMLNIEQSKGSKVQVLFDI